MQFSILSQSHLRRLQTAGQRSLIFVAVAVGLTSWVAGLSVASSFKFFVLSSIVALPGVRLLAWQNRASQELSGSELFILGVPLGYVICLGSQQFFLAIGLGTFGWTTPILVSLVGMRPSQVLRYGTDVQLKHIALFVTAASLVLADVNWAFMLIPLSLCVGLAAGRRSSGSFFLVALVAVRIAIDRYWYLVSDDRLFEEAYSRAIHNFGFWDWYGSSDTWVPYHWLGHAFGGLFQSLRIGTDFQSIGIAPQVLGAFILCSSLLVILRRLGFGETEAIVGIVLAPLLGRFALGVSNSADMSIALSFWAIAITVCVTRSPASLISDTLLVGTAAAAVVLTKFSTGIIVTIGVGVLVFELQRSQSGIFRSAVKSGIVIAVALTVAAANFGFIRSARFGDSRSEVEFLFGGYLRPLIGSSLLAGAIVVAALIAALLVPFALIRDQHVFDMRARAVLYSVTAMMLVGLCIRLLTLSYNNESYLEAAMLCATPLLAALVYIHLRHSFDWRLQVLLVLVGAGIGLGQRIIQFWSNSNEPLRGLQIISELSFIEIAVSILVGLITWRLMIPRTPLPSSRLFRMIVSCLLIGGFVGGDAFRVVLQLKTQTVWASTNFGASDQFFFGSDEEQEAAQWLRENSLPTDVIATNLICPLGEGCSLDGQSPISAWTHRRSFAEAERFITGRSADDVSFGELVPKGHPEWLMNRKRIMLEFASNQNESARQKLLAGGVRWFWLDVSLPNATVVNESLVKYQNSSIAILEL